jgi:hypothetical protein
LKPEVNRTAVVEALGVALLPLLPATAPLLLRTATALCHAEHDGEDADEDEGAREARLLARAAALAGVQALVRPPPTPRTLQEPTPTAPHRL